MSKRPLHRFSRNLQVGLVILYCLTQLLVLIASHYFTQNILVHNLHTQIRQLIHQLPDNGNESDLIRYLDDAKTHLFFRVTLLNEKMQVIFDTQQDLTDPNNSADVDYLHDHYKLVEAKERHYSFDEHLSSVTLREMVYIAMNFEYGGHNYILRSAFPAMPIHDLQLRVQFSFLVFGSITFLAFGFLTWALIRRLNRPLESFLQVVSQKAPELLNPTTGVTLIEIEDLPQDFDTLITTFNGLSEQVNRTLYTLAQERNEREAILNSMTEAVLSIDSKMEILYINPAGRQLLGLKAGEGREGSLLFEARFDKIRMLCLNVLSSKITFNEEIDLPGKSKNTHLDLIITPSEGGRVNLLLRDISQQYELNEMRKGFVANASHELRTPITIIRGFAETLRDHPEIENSMKQNVMQKIVTNCERMNTLITHLMNLSKIENLPLNDLSQLDLKKIIAQVLDQMHLVHPQAKIDFQPSKELFLVLGQEVLLSIVIKNLIENAIKYSDEAAHIEIGLHLKGDQVVLVVRDHGIGIPEEDLPYIFERFYTVDKARSKKAGGYGLGLSMVKTILDKHHAQVEVQSKPGEGTRFQLSFNSFQKE